VYAYYEKNDKYRANAEYFLQHGILPHVQYYIVLNGKCSVTIPVAPNVTVIQRENVGFDFGAYDSVLCSNDFSAYDFVFFLNTSVCGPYYERGADWTQPFLAMFKEDKDVKLVGTTINVLPQKISHLLPGDDVKRYHPHVQSMMFVVDRESLAFLHTRRAFRVTSTMTFAEIIGNIEVGISYLILKNGWNINCLLAGYRGLDYRKIDLQPNTASERTSGDPYYIGSYYDKTILPTDVIFFKNNRF
jgi:lipopolysaccharide biosynthesis protein